MKFQETSDTKKELKFQLNRVGTRNSGGAVDKNEDHATKSPCNAEDPDAAARIGLRLALVAYDREHGDVEEQKGGYELCYQSSVERPFRQLRRVEERRRRRVVVVLRAVRSVLRHLLRHSPPECVCIVVP